MTEQTRNPNMCEKCMHTECCCDAIDEAYFAGKAAGRFEIIDKAATALWLSNSDGVAAPNFDLVAEIKKLRGAS